MTNPPSIRLVTRGDDSGSCSSANHAILEAFRNGVLRNTSLMVPGPAFEEAAELFADVPGLCLGLHVVLNAEWDDVKWGPVLPPEEVPSLVDANGYFLPSPNKLGERDFSLDEIMAEVEAQFALARKYGLNLEYLDEHMGVGRVGGLRDHLKAFAARERLFYGDSVPHFPGVSNVNALLERLQNTSPGDYVLITHPGYDADDMRAYGHVGYEPGQVAKERENDRRLLTDPRLLQAAQDGLFTPVRYTDLEDC